MSTQVIERTVGDVRIEWVASLDQDDWYIACEVCGFAKWLYPALTIDQVRTQAHNHTVLNH